MRLPTIGLRSPPLAPGGGVICVNTAGDKPLKPFHSSAPRISTSQPSPNAVAAKRQAHRDCVAAAAGSVASSIHGNHPIRRSMRISM